jgi:hypothetical protein
VSLKTFISAVGSNPGFIAWNAHWGFAFFVVIAAMHFRHPGWFWPVIGACVVLAAVKEFWFDKHFELSPAQGFGDNLIDFCAYMSGLGAAIALLKVF